MMPTVFRKKTVTPSPSTRRTHLRTATLLALGAWLPGCRRREDFESPQPIDPPPPAFVYVPAPGFEVRVTIDMPRSVRVGQAIRLRATRESIGEWHRVRFASLPDGATWYTHPWPTPEPEVAANLTWQTDPPFAMMFDVGVRSLALGMQREGVFKAPGTYRVWALNAVPIRSRSNEIVVEVQA
jgi:hypothetical protein